jgi:hypothetical protein
MATAAFTHSIALINNGILAEHAELRRDTLDSISLQSESPAPDFTSCGEEEDMNNRTKAALLRQIQSMAIELLNRPPLKETEYERDRRLCKTLAAVFLCEIKGHTRIDETNRMLTTGRAQHPKLLAIAQDFAAFIEEQRLEMLQQLLSGLKHPEQSKLGISKELIEAATAKRRARTKSAAAE